MHYHVLIYSSSAVTLSSLAVLATVLLHSHHFLHTFAEESLEEYETTLEFVPFSGPPGNVSSRSPRYSSFYNAVPRPGYDKKIDGYYAMVGQLALRQTRKHLSPISAQRRPTLFDRNKTPL
ncbi:unnamed protein product [Heligmosomoides polygyrus]|uniref:Uncharacterized protein n=1 Tax=Heligmosomoides polygyrus TaxID=6339 RepID=A0A183G1N9_HELPZ|nr:unnamed protein product [Heligmosomoides polygyrus]